MEAGLWGVKKKKRDGGARENRLKVAVRIRGTASVKGGRNEKKKGSKKKS